MHTRRVAAAAGALALAAGVAASTGTANASAVRPATGTSCYEIGSVQYYQDTGIAWRCWFVNPDGEVTDVRWHGQLLSPYHDYAGIDLFVDGNYTGQSVGYEYPYPNPSSSNTGDSYLSGYYSVCFVGTTDCSPAGA